MSDPLGLEAIISASIDRTPEPTAPVETTPDPVAEVENPDAPVETTDETPADVEKPVETPVAQTPEEILAADAAAKLKAEEPVDEFAQEHDIKPKTADGRENRIPYSRVTKITGNAVKKATEALAATHTAAIAETTAKVTEYESRLKKIGETEHILFNEQARFIEVLKTIPGYSELFAKMSGPAVVSTRPAPDAADGKGYTQEGLDKLLEWNRTEALNEATKAHKAELDRRLGPVEKEREAAAYEAALIPTIQAEMAEAESWPMFVENADAILAELKANPDPKFGLQQAWRKIVYPKLTTDRTKMRAEILAELARAPRSTSAPVAPALNPTVVPIADPNAPVDLEAIIRQSIAGKK